MITGENDVFVCDGDGNPVAHSMWDEAAEAEARALGGYLCRPNVEPLQVLADFRPVPEMDTFTVYAEDGEYSEQAGTLFQALAQFLRRRPALFVSAVVNNGMRPRLVIEQEACVSTVLAAGSPGGEAVRVAAERELAGSERWDEVKDLTLADLLARNQDALIDDWFEDPSDEIAALVVGYDRLLGTRRAAELESAARAEPGAPRLGRQYQAQSLPPGSVVTTGTGTEYVISRRGLCMRWEQPIPLSGLWTVIYAGRLAAGEWMTPRERAEVDERQASERDINELDRVLPEDETARMSRLAEVIEEVTGADFDTAAQLAQEAISKAAHVRSLERLRASIEKGG